MPTATPSGCCKMPRRAPERNGLGRRVDACAGALLEHALSGRDPQSDVRHADGSEREDHEARRPGADEHRDAERHEQHDHRDRDQLGAPGHAQAGSVVAHHRSDAGEVEHPPFEPGARVRETPGGDDEAHRRRHAGDDDADGADRDRDEPPDEPSGTGDRSSLRKQGVLDAHDTSSPTSIATRTTRKTMTTLFSAMSGTRQAWVLERHRRMLSTLKAMATTPTSTPTTGPTPPAIPRTGRTHGKTT